MSHDDENDSETETTNQTPLNLRGLGSQRLRLIVMGQQGAASFELPVAGEVTIGRSRDCQVQINDAKLSRKHATLRIGTKLELVDLGSANGTRVGNTAIPSGETVAIEAGDMLILGSTVMLVQVASASTRLRHIWSHGYFEARIEDECARADQGGKGFAVVRLRLQGPTAAGALEERFAEWLRPMDVVATYSPSEYEVLLVEMDPASAEEVAERMRTALDPKGVRVSVGVACYPRDGRTPETLVAKAGSFAGGGVPERPSSAPVVKLGALERMDPMIARVAAGQISVLVIGETGSGKEVLASRLHALSPRAKKPLLCLNCAALSEALLESELFGHERGAFTGALQAKAGLLESAEGGTVFLDEVGEMPLAMQAKLLRVLEKRQVMRVGAIKLRAIDVRFLSATNRDLEAEVRRGAFRQDLYFRLNGVTLVVPPLRQRVDEIEPLARMFVAELSQHAPGKRVPKIGEEALALLRSYSWPGNIRELRNVIERAVLLCEGDTITLEHLPHEKMGRTLPSARHFAIPEEYAMSPEISERDAGPMTQRLTMMPPRSVVENEDITGVTAVNEPMAATPEEERERIAAALHQCAGNQTNAAKLLGISRRTLVSRLGQYAMPRPRKRP